MSAIDTSLSPRAQTKLIGHTEAFNQLHKGFMEGTLPACWMLIGQKGIGKSTLAYNLSRYILSKNSTNNEGLNETLVTRQIATGSYPNLLTLERSLNADGVLNREIMIEETRSLLNFLHHSPTVPGWRVVIIDSIDEMNHNASNALLKILEEPPTRVLMLLICHSMGRVLPTLRSRCAKMSLFPLTNTEIEEAFPKEIAQQLTPLLPLSSGSLGQALQLHNAGGLTFVKQLEQAFRSALQGKFSVVRSFCEDIVKDVDKYNLILDLIDAYIHSIITSEKSDFLSHKSHDHWIRVWQSVHYFSQLVKTSHLDKTQALLAIFMMIENPNLGNNFIHAQFNS